MFFAARPFRSVPLATSVVLYLWHTCFCLYYARFALNNTADARGYYTRSIQSDFSFSLGTGAIDNFTAIFTQLFGFSYLGAFLLYNIIGAIGLVAILAAMREALSGKGRWVRFFALLVVFLPGASFWSVAIGKDAPALLGVGLLSWAALNIRKRWMALLLGIFSVVLVRPHIVAVILVGLALATLMVGKLRPLNKIVVVFVIAVPAVFAFRFAMASIGLGDFGAFSSVDEFIDYRQSVNMDGGSSIDISSMVLPVQMFFYAFGPLFFGASGLMGLVASVENAFLLFLVAMSAKNVLRKKSSLPPFAKWFFLFYGLSLWVVFALTTANLGIALRQKWMFMPMLLLFFLSYAPDRYSENRRSRA